MSYLTQIALPLAAQRRRPIADLEQTHGITPRSSRMYERFYGLQEVAQQDLCLGAMLDAALGQVLADLPGGGRGLAGQLVYCKTQTHNTFGADGWLRALADARGLHDWEVMSLSMTSCASALVQMHVAQLLGDAPAPLIILTGEKAFHPWVSRLPVGLLAEVPAAALFHPAQPVPGAGGWCIRGSHVQHLPQFHANPDAMSPEERQALQAIYLPRLIGFLEDSLQRYRDHLSPEMVFLPHNLNLPMTRQIVDHFGWGARCFQGDVAHIGHGYCSDIFLNLDALHRDGRPAPQVLVLAAGTGVTFASCLLDHLSPSQP